MPCRALAAPADDSRRRRVRPRPAGGAQAVPPVEGRGGGRPGPALCVDFVELGVTRHGPVVQPGVERLEVVRLVSKVKAHQPEGLGMLEMEAELVGFPGGPKFTGRGEQLPLSYPVGLPVLRMAQGPRGVGDPVGGEAGGGLEGQADLGEVAGKGWSGGRLQGNSFSGLVRL